MKTYIVKTRHRFQNDDSHVYHTHRVSMPEDKYRELKRIHGLSKWPFHSWVEKQLEKRIPNRNWRDDTGQYWYISSCKLER